MLFATVLLPEGKSERKLLQLCYPLLTSPSKAPTRGHCSGGEEKKKNIPTLSTMEETLSSIVITETYFVGLSLLIFLYLLSVFAHLSLSENMSASARRICMTQNTPSVTQGPHFCRPTLPLICQCSFFPVASQWTCFCLNIFSGIWTHLIDFLMARGFESVR